MNQSHALGLTGKEPPILNADVDASLLDEDAWEDATNDSGLDLEMLCHSQWRTSMLDSVD